MGLYKGHYSHKRYFSGMHSQKKPMIVLPFRSLHKGKISVGTIGLSRVVLTVNRGKHRAARLQSWLVNSISAFYTQKSRNATIQYLHLLSSWNSR